MGILDDDLASIMAEAGETGGDTVEIDGVEMACELGQPDAALAPGLDSDIPDISVTLLVPATEYTPGTPPKEGARALYHGKPYRVVRVLEAPDGLEMEVSLAKPGR